MNESSSTRRRSTRSETERAGYVSMEDENLPHSGVRGGRSCCLCAGIVFLMLLAIINALITAGLLYFLSITHEGMTSLEFLPGRGHLRILSDIEIENLQVEDLVGEIGTNFDLSGEEVVLGVLGGSEVKLQGNNTYFMSEDLELKTMDDKPLFSTKVPLNLEMYHVKNLHASAIDVGSILSRQVTSQSMFPDLLIESFNDADVFGMEGVTVESDGPVQIMAAEKDITIQSLDGSLSLSQEEGIVMSSDLPLYGKDTASLNDMNQYKVCVCGTNGRVFVVQNSGTDSGCHLANENVNPCV